MTRRDIIRKIIQSDRFRFSYISVPMTAHISDNQKFIRKDRPKAVIFYLYRIGSVNFRQDPIHRPLRLHQSDVRSAVHPHQTHLPGR